MRGSKMYVAEMTKASSENREAIFKEMIGKSI